MKRFTAATAAAAAAALAAMVSLGGCRADGDADRQAQVDQSADLAEHNRMLIRMSLAENVYNGTAVARAVYPRDFDHGHATLNPLGLRRVETLIDVLRDGGQGQVVIVRGEASDDLYDARVASVRAHLVDAGLDPDEVPVVQGLPAGSSLASSERALVMYDKLMKSYVSQSGGGGATGGGSGAGMQSSGNAGGYSGGGK